MKRHLSERSARQRAAGTAGPVDAASREFDVLLEQIAVPLFPQWPRPEVQGYPFDVFSQAAGANDVQKNAGRFIELTLDTTGDEPRSWAQPPRARPAGSGIERAIAEGRFETSRTAVLAFLLKELEPFVENKKVSSEVQV